MTAGKFARSVSACRVHHTGRFPVPVLFFSIARQLLITGRQTDGTQLGLVPVLGSLTWKMMGAPGLLGGGHFGGGRVRVDDVLGEGFVEGKTFSLMRDFWVMGDVSLTVKTKQETEIMKVCRLISLHSGVPGAL